MQSPRNTTRVSRLVVSLSMRRPSLPLFFFFNDTATTEIYTLSLHDALPIWSDDPLHRPAGGGRGPGACARVRVPREDRKSTRLNSSHGYISYAVFCLKKKKKPHLAFHTLATHTELSLHPLKIVGLTGRDSCD